MWIYYGIIALAHAIWQINKNRRYWNGANINPYTSRATHFVLYTLRLGYIPVFWSELSITEILLTVIIVEVSRLALIFIFSFFIVSKTTTKSHDYSDKRGFVPIIPLIITSIAILMAGGAGYGINLWQQQKEKVNPPTTEQVVIEETDNGEQLSLLDKLEIVRKHEDELTKGTLAQRSKQENTNQTFTSETPVAEPPSDVSQEVRLLTEDDKDLMRARITTYTEHRKELVDNLKKWKDKFKSSDYRSEYSETELLIEKTTDYFQEEIDLGNLMLEAISVAKDDQHERLISAYKAYDEMIKNTNQVAPEFFDNIKTLEDHSNKIVENLIKLEVIDELSQQYGVSGYGSQSSVSSSSYTTLSSQADQYIKDLQENNKKLEAGYGKTIKNYLIGIVIFY